MEFEKAKEEYLAPKKIKDLTPEETVRNAKEFLKSIECYPKYTYSKTDMDTYTSTLDGSPWGLVSFGKGVTPELCEASAYGEYIERLQNLIYGLDLGVVSDNNCKFKFRNWPDEREVLLWDNLMQFPDIVKDYLNEWKKNTSEDSELSFKGLISLITNEMDSPYCYEVPYYDVFRGCFRYLPQEPLSILCGTVGMCAGNSPEEALTQGLSEVFEKWAERTALEEGVTPPEIPFTYIEKEEPYLYSLMNSFMEKYKGRFSIKVYDMSFGCNIPVISILIFDKKYFQYRLQSGAHPLFKIALERCITEVVQSLDFSNEQYDEAAFTSWNLETSQRAQTRNNISSQFTCALASVPPTWCGATPSWEFKPWRKIENFDNYKGLDFFLRLLKKIKYPLYIRDTTLSSLYTYSIYIPDFSVYPKVMNDSLAYGGLISWASCLDVEWDNCNLEEKKALLNYLKIYGPQFLGPRFKSVSQTLIATAIALELGDLDAALTFVKKSAPGNRKAKIVEKEIELRLQGLDEEDRDAWLLNFFEKEELDYLNTVWRSTYILESLFKSDPEYLSREEENLNALSLTKNLLQERISQCFPKTIEKDYFFLQKYSSLNSSLKEEGDLGEKENSLYECASKC